MNPLISVCIPAYKNAGYLTKLLESIASQTFHDYEVVIADDSPNDEVAILCEKYNDKFPLVYHKNIPAKGSPANWNVGIRMAKGKWIKIMHDDDWFATGNALGSFANAINENPWAEFIFSGYADYENGNLKYVNIVSDTIKKKLAKSPLNLFIKNYIGNPSTTIIKNNLNEWYDENLKWVVDFEFYIRCLKDKKLFGIPEVLVNVGLNKDQVTKEVFRNMAVEIPENIYMLNKLGTAILKNIRVYDYYWRIFRNLNVRSMGEVEKNLFGNMLPKEIISMLHMQLKIPMIILRQGILSKLLMAIAYRKNLRN